MALKEFGSKKVVTLESAIKEVNGLIKSNPPIELRVVDGKVIYFAYESEWQEGETKPVHDDEGEVVDYTPEYKTCKLTKAEIKKLDDWAAENLEQ